MMIDAQTQDILSEYLYYGVFSLAACYASINLSGSPGRKWSGHLLKTSLKGIQMCMWYPAFSPNFSQDEVIYSSQHYTYVFRKYSQ